jgi:hypothetical protein
MAAKGKSKKIAARRRAGGKFYKNGQVAAIDHKFTGEEPTWEDQHELNATEFDSKLIKAFSFYNYYLDSPDYGKHVRDFMKKNGWPKVSLGGAKALCRYSEVSTVGKILRCISRGLDANHKHLMKRSEMKDRIQRAIKQCPAFASDEESNDPSVPSKPKRKSPRELLKMKVDEKVNQKLDVMLDRWIAEGKDKPPVLDIIKLIEANDIPPAGVTFVEDWINKHHDEMMEALKGDKQLAEGYAYLSTNGLKMRIVILQHFKKKLKEWVKGKRAVSRKPRTPKVKTANKQIERLKYQAASKDFNLQSASPLRVPGAQHVFLFNTKYKTLTVIHARNHDGITISGTTLKNYDEDASFTIGLRKPNEVLPKVLAKTPKQINKLCAELTTKQRKANGRVNENTIILRTIEKRQSI